MPGFSGKLTFLFADARPRRTFAPRIYESPGEEGLQNTAVAITPVVRGPGEP